MKKIINILIIGSISFWAFGAGLEEKKEKSELGSIKNVIAFFRSPLYLRYKAEKTVLTGQLHKGASLTPQQFFENLETQKKLDALATSKLGFDVEATRVTLGIPLLKYFEDERLAPIRKIGTLHENHFLDTISVTSYLRNSIPQYHLQCCYDGYLKKYQYIELEKNGRPQSPALLYENVELP